MQVPSDDMQGKPDIQKHFWAGGFLYDPGAARVLLHKRDGNTSYNPNKWAFFGGLREEGEHPERTCVREFHEETGILLPESDLVLLNHDYHVEHRTYRYVFFVLGDVDRTCMRRGEGAACEWVRLRDAFGLDLSDKTRRDLRLFTGMLAQGAGGGQAAVHK